MCTALGRTCEEKKKKHRMLYICNVSDPCLLLPHRTDDTAEASASEWLMNGISCSNNNGPDCCCINLAIEAMVAQYMQSKPTKEGSGNGITLPHTPQPSWLSGPFFKVFLPPLLFRVSVGTCNTASLLVSPPLHPWGEQQPRLCSGCKNLQVDPKRHHPFDFQCLQTMMVLSSLHEGSEISERLSITSKVSPSEDMTEKSDVNAHESEASVDSSSGL
jgi:hypothetical protein